MANLLYTPYLEESGHCVKDDMQGGWILHTPDGTPTVFKRYNGLCNTVPYTNMQESQPAVAIVQTVLDNFEGCTKKQVEKAL